MNNYYKLNHLKDISIINEKNSFNNNINNNEYVVEIEGEIKNKLIYYKINNKKKQKVNFNDNNKSILNKHKNETRLDLLHQLSQLLFKQIAKLIKMPAK